MDLLLSLGYVQKGSSCKCQGKNYWEMFRKGESMFKIYPKLNQYQKFQNNVWINKKNISEIENDI